MSTQTPSANTNTSPKALIKQLVAAATSGTVFNGFLLTHLGEDVQGAVSPRYGLNKPETIKRFAEAFAFAAGGTATLVAVMEESIRGWRWPGPVVCSGKRHNRIGQTRQRGTGRISHVRMSHARLGATRC